MTQVHRYTYDKEGQGSSRDKSGLLMGDVTVRRHTLALMPAAICTAMLLPMEAICWNRTVE